MSPSQQDSKRLINSHWIMSSTMDPIYFMPENKQCYDLIDEDLTYSDSIDKSIAPLETVLTSNDPKTIEEYFLTCCEFGNIENVKKLLHLKAGLINVRDSDGYTGLHRASYGGHVSVMSELLDAGACITAVTDDGWQPLHCACRWNCTDAASLLLANGADINCQTNGGQTPLHLASTTPDHAKTLEMLLLTNGLHPSLKNGANETAYEIAVRSGPHYKLFEILDPSI